MPSTFPVSAPSVLKDSTVPPPAAAAYGDGVSSDAGLRTALALRETEERFRLTLDEAPIGMALVSPVGSFMRVNRALCEIVGYPADELGGMTFQAITHPEDLDTDLALAGQLARGEIPRYTLEKRYIRKDGSIVDVELSASALRGPDGQLVHFIAQIEDITERKRVQKEQQFLAELGPVLISTLDPQGMLRSLTELAVQRVADFCVVDITDQGERLHKCVASRDPSKRALAEALEQVPLDRMKPFVPVEAVRTRRPVLAQFPSDESLAAMTQSAEHFRIVKALGMVSMIAVPLIAGDRLLGAIALIAARGSRGYESRDLPFAEELAWRTAMALENARLYQAAREATRLRDEVLAIVAHDLRNPLSAIALQAAMLRRRSQPRAGSEATAGAAIQRAATRMSRLIDDLLDISRIEAGRLSVMRARLAVSPFLSECIASQLDLAAAALVELHLEVPHDLPDVWADRDRLSQVFENLIGNALKFTKPHGRVVVGAEGHEHEVLLTVRDTGGGISPEHLPHLFDRFWRARRSERQGAGLGLPIVKSIVEAHGGSIRVESAPGEGAAFFFTIPRADALPPERGG